MPSSCIEFSCDFIKNRICHFDENFITGFYHTYVSSCQCLHSIYRWIGHQHGSAEYTADYIRQLFPEWFYSSPSYRTILIWEQTKGVLTIVWLVLNGGIWQVAWRPPLHRIVCGSNQFRSVIRNARCLSVFRQSCMGPLCSWHSRGSRIFNWKRQICMRIWSKIVSFIYIAKQQSYYQITWLLNELWYRIMVLGYIHRDAVLLSYSIRKIFL